MDYDVLLAGGGLANGLIALRLAQARPEVRVGIVEAGKTIGGNHTWSSFALDLTPAQREWTAPLFAYRWDRYQVRFPGQTRKLEAGYGSCTSENLAAEVARALPKARVMTDMPIVALTPTSVTLADQRVLTATTSPAGWAPPAGAAAPSPVPKPPAMTLMKLRFMARHMM